MQDRGQDSEWRGERMAATKANGKRVFAVGCKVYLQASRRGVSLSATPVHNEINANQLLRWMRLEHLSQRLVHP